MYILYMFIVVPIHVYPYVYIWPFSTAHFLENFDSRESPL